MGHFSHNIHTQMHNSTYILSVQQNCLDPEKHCIVKLNENGKICWSVSTISVLSFFVELLLREGNFGHNTHTLKCNLALINNQFSITA